MPHLLSLLRCLYEAQDPSLCQSVVNQLEELNFRGTSLSPMDLLSIGYLIGMSNTYNTVKEVSFGIHQLCGDYDVKSLMKYPACTKGTGTWKFDLCMNSIHEEGAASIAKVLQSSSVIYSLNLMENPIGTGGLQSLAEALITNTSLVELNLLQCSFEITDENGPIVTEMLQRNKTLRKLNLVNNKISDTGIVYIAKGLEKNIALKCLEMSGIRSVGGKALASAIAKNASLPLVEFTLDGRDMITEDSKLAFIDMLRQNTSIKTLKLTSVGVIGKPMPFLAEGLQSNSTLRQLNLCHYMLTPDMVKDVSRMLAVNRSLTSLDISMNPIGDDGVTHLAEALKQNKTLKQLAICNCDNITYAGVAPLAEALKQNISLKQLSIRRCGVFDAGVAPLAEALKQNKTLEELNISECGVTDAGVAPLAEALQVNNSLRQLDVWGNKLTKNGWTKLRELAAKKSNFHVVSY